MQIKDAVGLGSGFLSGEKPTESRDRTLQLPNTTPKRGQPKCTQTGQGGDALVWSLQKSASASHG